MENKELSKLLSQLQDEIKNTQAIDEKGLELLRDLERDINALLERSGESAEPSQPINIENLESTLSYFEASHPSLTVLISRLLDTLSNSGI